MWGQLIGAGVSLVGGLLGGKKASKTEKAASAATALQSQISKEQWDRYKQVYDPLEREIVNDARAYDSAENFSLAAGEASADVSSQFGKMRERLARTPGLDPSSAAFQSSAVGLDMAQAATDATMQNASRQRIRDTAFARKTGALSMGKGLDTTAAMGAGNAARGLSDLAGTQRENAAGAARGLGNFASNLYSAFRPGG
jgi:hypothetical protein